MTAVPNGTWYPNAAHLHSSGAARLARALGLTTYDEMLRYALAEPGQYWAGVLMFCEVVWDERPTGYVDTGEGREFPHWFPGGRLNWVNSILAFGERAESRARRAVVGELEDGRIDSLTYLELGVRIREFAAALSAAGVSSGDRVGLLMENGIEATVSFLAIAYLGAIAVPLFSGFGAEAVVARLSAAEARLLIASPGFPRRGRHVDLESVVRKAWPQLPALERVVWKHTGPSASADPDRESDWHTLLAAARGTRLAPASVSPDHPFMIVYTSGTTGKPKGIVHTHGGFPLKIVHDAVVHFDLNPGEVLCWPADMGWIAGTLVMSCALLRGATLVCYSGGPDYPDWSRMSRIIERHQVTHFGSAPTLIRGMAGNAPEALRGDVSSVRVLVTGGEGIDPEHFRWFQQHFGRGTCPLINYTGGTEASGALLASVVVRPIVPSGFNSTSPGIAVDVVAPDGRPVTDSVGELAIREPFLGMTRSFWRDDARYLETYWQTIPGLWLHGDLALRRGDGQFFLRGRSDDTLKIAGKRLGPAEVEEAVLRLGGIMETAAIGVADDEKGERLVIFVVCDASEAAESAAFEERIARHIEDTLGRPFRPSAVHRVTQLPKTRSFKTMRRVIRSLYCGTPPGDLSSLDNPASLEEIRALATKRAH